MATMFPNRLSDCENASEGERLVYSFLRETARPDREFICWYTPEIQKKEADFIVFCRRHGLVVIEVKDWVIDQIKSADRHSFTLRISGKFEKRENPFRQARGYVNALMGALKEHQCFLSDDPSHPGEVRIPIGRLVAFPNIGKEESCRRGYERLIPPSDSIFKEELDPIGEIWEGERWFKCKFK